MGGTSGTWIGHRTAAITMNGTRRRSRGGERGTTSVAAAPAPRRTATVDTPRLLAARPRLSSGPGGGAPAGAMDRRIGERLFGALCLCI